jgi:predicted nucleotidyltransferase
MYKEYASYFVSYLLMNLKDKENINKIVLFGSAAKEEATKESDIDLFVDTKKESKRFSEEVRKVLEDFYTSRESMLFRAKGIDNKINIITGNLDKWKELKGSIENTGIVLYGKYVPAGIRGRKYLLLAWDKIGTNRGAFLNKVYGFNAGGKHYAGLAEKFNCKRIGKSSIMIPVENKDEILNLIKKHKVSSKFLEVWSE